MAVTGLLPGLRSSHLIRRGTTSDHFTRRRLGTQSLGKNLLARLRGHPGRVWPLATWPPPPSAHAVSWRNVRFGPIKQNLLFNELSRRAWPHSRGCSAWPQIHPQIGPSVVLEMGGLMTDSNKRMRKRDAGTPRQGFKSKKTPAS